MTSTERGALHRNRLARLMAGVRPAEIREGMAVGELFAVGGVEERWLEAAARKLEELAREGVAVVTPEEAEYPERLRLLRGFPVMLFYRGRIDGLGRTAGVIGTRRGDRYGLEVARSVTRQLVAQGLLTPSCSLASLGTEEAAGRALELLAQLSEDIRQKYS